MAHEIGYVSSRLALYKPARHAQVDPRAAFFANWDRETDNANVDLLCAEMSRLAYADRTTVRESLERPGFMVVDYIGGENLWARLRYRGTQGFLACNEEGVTILAFRGTESNKFEDVLADLRLRLKPWPGSEARVHAGFRSCYLSVRDRVHRLLATSPGHDGQRPRKLFLTGHSLGGALATLAAADLKACGVEVAGVVTFGSPLVGDVGLSRLLAGIPVRRYVDCCDLIARVPPERLDRDHVRELLKDLTSHRWPHDSFEARVVPRLGRAVTKLFSAAGGPPNYAHVDTLVYLDRQGRTSQAMRPEDRRVDQDTARREYAQVRDGGDRVGARDLADHAPINYVSALAGRVEAAPIHLYTRDEVLA